MEGERGAKKQAPGGLASAKVYATVGYLVLLTDAVVRLVIILHTMADNLYRL